MDYKNKKAAYQLMIVLALSFLGLSVMMAFAWVL